MLELLGPWLATADRLAPRWRSCVETRRAIDLSPWCEDARRWRPRDEAELVQLRETLEMLGLALAVDGVNFMEALRGERSAVGEERYSGERLRIKVIQDTDRRELPLKVFFTDWNEEIASDDYKSTKRMMEKLYSDETSGGEIGERFDLEFELRLETVAKCKDVAFMTEVLASIDRDRFTVNYIALVAQYPAFDPISVADLFHMAEVWRASGAAVEVTIYLPGEDEILSSLSQWMHLFRCAYRYNEPLPLSVSPGATWSVRIECSENDTEGEYMIDMLLGLSGTRYTIARLLVASLVPPGERRRDCGNFESPS